MSKRIIFTFDDRSLSELMAFMEDGGFDSLASAVRASLSLSRALQKQAKQGYKQIIVENSNGKSRTLASSPLVVEK